MLSDSNGDGVPDTVTTASRSQAWNFDALGNWDSVITDGSAQTGTANKQNQITSLSGQTTPAYDGNGNTTTDQAGKTLVYDAWNRLVVYKDGTTTLVSYQYDALNRRIVENPGTAVDLYFSSSWQLLEERQGGQAKAQYVWSPVYVDALVLRDRDADGNGSLDERLYVGQDANYNVVVLFDNTASVVERYANDPYGAVTVLTPNWSERSGSSQFSWIYLHQGGGFEGVIGLYYFRTRDYSSNLGRFAQPDPLGLEPDVNFYRYVANNPAAFTDYLGQAITTVDGALEACMRLPTAAARQQCIENLIAL